MRAIALGAGAELDTDAAGRNGIGTALRLGTSSFVRGADHDDERFFDLVCAASPVLHPVNSSVCGVINVTGHLKASHSHVALALKLIVSQIRGELVRATPPRPLRLADAHRRLTAHMPNAVATFDENTLIAEDALTPQLATVNRRELWESLSTLSVTAKEMVLPTGHRVRVVPVTKGTWSHGASAVFDIPRANAVDAVGHDGDGGPLTLLEEAERSVIASVLRQYDGNKSDAAERLGVCLAAHCTHAFAATVSDASSARRALRLSTPLQRTAHRLRASSPARVSAGHSTQRIGGRRCTTPDPPHRPLLTRRALGLRPRSARQCRASATPCCGRRGAVRPRHRVQYADLRSPRPRP